MSAKCYYLDSPKSYYDQTNTYNAISESELFISDLGDLTNSGAVFGVKSNIFLSKNFPLDIEIGLVSDFNQDLDSVVDMTLIYRVVVPSGAPILKDWAPASNTASLAW